MGTLFTALGAAAALAGTDIIPVHQGGPRAVGLTGAQLLTYVGGSYVGKTGAQSMTGGLTIASGTLTASAPALNVTQTWNAGAVGFVGAIIDITNTASAGASYPLVIKVNGSSVFEFTKAGRFNATQVSTGLVQCSYIDVGSFSDTLIHRDSAATLAQRNGTNAQTLRVYGTYTDSSNYERLSLSTTAGTSVNITAETLGTGADNLDVLVTSAGTGSIKFNTWTYVTNAGNLYSAGFYIAGNGAATEAGGLSLKDTGLTKWSSTSVYSGSADAGLARNAAGVVEVNNGTAGTFRDLKLRNLIQTEYSQLTEMTAPSAPAANSVRIYAEDNGAGKTRLMALFATGAAQQIAIEP